MSTGSLPCVSLHVDHVSVVVGGVSVPPETSQPSLAPGVLVPGDVTSGGNSVVGSGGNSVVGSSVSVGSVVGPIGSSVSVGSVVGPSVGVSVSV